VSPGHALVVTRRHVADWFDATDEERTELTAATAAARSRIVEQHRPDGFNIGVNVAEAGGQTVPHLHVHVIPRYAGDVDDPRGGVRYVLPAKANYIAHPLRVSDTAATYDASIRPPEISGWDTRPLISTLVHDLAHAHDVDIAVAFVLESGLERLEPHLFDVLDRGGRIRFLTGDYLDCTEPRALRRLLDLTSSLKGSAQIRVFQTTKDVGFHPKTYHLPDRAAYVGSSNLSKRALEQGIEWNYGSAIRPPSRRFARNLEDSSSTP
jgi:diadenosine tetraphosphate (Ap4A) HIT family hydrolase